MADYTPAVLTRASSTESSALSNINGASAVAGAEEDASSRVSGVSTPPTSLPDAESATMDSVEKQAAAHSVDKGTARRPKRARAGPSSYNLKKLSDAQLPITAGSSRNASGLTGRTLVEDDGERLDTPSDAKVKKVTAKNWEIPASLPPRQTPGPLQRRPSVKDRVKKAATRVGSVLGKRGREVMEAGKRTLGRKTRDEDDEAEEEVEEDVPRWKKALDMGPKGLLEELDLDVEPELNVPPPAKKARLSTKAALKEMSQAPAAPVALAKAATASKGMKKWQKEGLFVGQDADFDPSLPGGKRKLQKKRPGSSALNETSTIPAPSRRALVSLPMFSYLDKTRDFVVPYDVFAPSFKKGDEKPKDWHQVNRNRLVGEAKEMWEKSERLPASMCVCREPAGEGDVGCGDDCLNRIMQYECNDDNCNLSESLCGNRLFADLAVRMKKGGAFDVGVEVLKTTNRGFGVRSCRTWAPGEIIMEYTGEIVSEGECQRRMREDYKDKQCYYLMELERGLIIDGTKGSMARFINHSCEPNCEVRMVKVNGTPRMGVFAGERGVATGEELTYDYNFDNFGESQQKCFCGAPTCRGYLSKRLNAWEQKKLAKVESDKKRKAVEVAQAHAEHEERKKKSKSERGSNWRGWVAVDDPETKARLKQERAEKEEAAKSSDRAMRMAARRGSLPASAGVAAFDSATKPRKDSKRRRTVAVQQEVARTTEDDAAPGDEAGIADESEAEVVPNDDDDPSAQLLALASSPVKSVMARPKVTHKRKLSSTGSKFVEDLPRPISAHSTATVTRKTEIIVTETATAEEKTAVHPAVSGLGGARMDEGGVDGVVPAKKRPIKDAVKSGLQAVKNSLFGAAGRPRGDGKEDGGAKGLKQSTLSFAKVG
ncbi:hypothetical protein LTR53_014182 [Teratosphaeriaceae sp. CCFEE 6253]|nr:hypothetical protein LTR53_014182 [Teratosphaeriaceae sp. CCFEE 6253]